MPVTEISKNEPLVIVSRRRRRENSDDDNPGFREFERIFVTCSGMPANVAKTSRWRRFSWVTNLTGLGAERAIPTRDEVEQASEILK